MDINLKQFREDHDVTQVEMARGVGVSLGAYIKWEQQVINPNEKNEKNLLKLIEEIKQTKMMAKREE
jgi:DNA-binding XRE family transcriptional regulator